jgi:predicted DNA-binding transcriptional regulator AlpA
MVTVQPPVKPAGIASPRRLTDSPAPDRLLTVREVAAWLGVSTRTVYRLVAAGTFPPPIRYSHKTARWFGSDVRRHLERLRKERAPW